MSRITQRRRALLSWLFIFTLFALCGLLAMLQYRWIGEVSVAASERLHGSLQATLFRLSQGLNTELRTALSPLLPPSGPVDPKTLQQDLVARYGDWKTSHDRRMLRHLSLVIPRNQGVELLDLDLDSGALHEAAWPDEWNGLKTWMEAALTAQAQWESGRPQIPQMDSRFGPSTEEFTVETPLFSPGGGPFGGREAGWLIVDLNPVYLREVTLAEIVQRYLGVNGNLDYQVEVVAKSSPKTVIYKSDLRQGSIAAHADAMAGLFDPGQLLYGNMGGRGNRGGRGGRNERGERGGPPDAGRWEIYVRHRAGSLEAVVAQARWRNLALAAALLLLIVATAAALIRFTRRTQRLAELQMDFVAGVSHELRTPLTVIHTAAYNLQGKMAHDPAQVERYGKLIQRKAGRLNNMVEQILRFASAESGRVIEEREPLSIDSVIEEALSASKPLIEGSMCDFKKQIAPDLPLVMGDRTSLRQVIENLLTNAGEIRSERR